MMWCSTIEQSVEDQFLQKGYAENDREGDDTDRSSESKGRLPEVGITEGVAEEHEVQEVKLSVDPSVESAYYEGNVELGQCENRAEHHHIHNGRPEKR